MADMFMLMVLSIFGLCYAVTRSVSLSLAFLALLLFTPAGGGDGE
jgi:hypothetical protein